MTDDAGLLGLLDPDAYVSFVDAQWTLDQLRRHLAAQMRERRLLLWGTGREEIWRVGVELEGTSARGFREVTGPIVSTRGRLLLTHWGALTMAATYSDVALPEPHERDLLLEVPAGAYDCRVVQLDDPEAERPDEHDSAPPRADFVLALTPARGPGEPWAEPPWADVLGEGD